MFQTIYTNKKRGFSQEVTPTPEFMRQYEGTCRDYPLMVYPVEMGIKQAIPDSMAGVTDEATFCAKILKKADAVWAGTVRVAGSGERQPTKTPMEREVWRIAVGELAEVFAKLKVAKEKQAAYVRMLIERDRARLEEMARVNIEAEAAIKGDLFEALESLFDAFESES